MHKINFIYQNAFSQTGGIQTFNKYFIDALEEIANENNNVHAEIVSIYDRHCDIDTSLPFQSLNHSKVAAFKYIIANAKKFNIFIFAHVNLAPLAVVLRVLNKNAKIIFCTHGIDVWKKLPSYTEWIMNRSTILTVSNFSMDKLKRYNPKLQDIRLFPNCIKVNDTTIKHKNPYDPNEFNILSVTRLSASERLKGIDTVIKALPSLVEKIPNIKYSLIGKGDDVPRLEKLANELGVSQYVDFLGFVDDIGAYYQYCDIFTLPSKKEGFGIVYLEAMQYKKPVIAVNYGGPTDVVIDGKTGFLIPYNDIDSLVDRIHILYLDEVRRKTFGEKGYRRLMEKFTFYSFKKQLENILVC